MTVSTTLPLVVFALSILPETDRPLCHITYQPESVSFDRIRLLKLQVLRYEKIGWASKSQTYLTWPIAPQILLEELLPLLKSAYRAYKEPLYLSLSGDGVSRNFVVIRSFWKLRIMEVFDLTEKSVL